VKLVEKWEKIAWTVVWDEKSARKF
jgi:hypothetical protein